MSTGTPGTPGTPGATASTNLPMSFSRSTDQKLDEKLADIAVVSLVPPVSIGSSQQSSTSGGSNAASAGTREDYDSSATVRPSFCPVISQEGDTRLNYVVLMVIARTDIS